MNFERSRLRTFQNWPADAPVDSVRIAKAGFYYMGQNLEVQCFSCGGRISEWQFGDMVMAKHRLLDPRCPFVVNPVDSGNVPITNADLNNHPPTGGTSRLLNKRPIEMDLSDRSKYRTEAARLETFVTWPIPSKVEGYRLAKAGFYYLQELDRVRCAFCDTEAYNWEAGDDPVVEHRRHFPMCPFLSNLSVGCSTRNSDDVITLREEYCNFEHEYGLDANRMRDLGILNHRIPKHSKYMTEEARISSFEKWPKSDVKDPIELAKAGFYYTGVEDKVRCYHCGGGLQKWKANDDPWAEHTKWFSNCDFIFLVKGEEFITEVKRNHLIKNESQDQQGTSNDNIRSVNPQVIDDNFLQVLMTSAPVLSTLDLGLDMSRVKQVLRDRLERHKKGFSSEDELIAAVLDAQFNEPVADLTEESWIGEASRNVPRPRRQLSGHSSATGSSERYSDANSLLGQNFQTRGDDPLSMISEVEDNPLIMIREFLDSTPDPPEEFSETDNNNSELEHEIPLPNNQEMLSDTPDENKSFFSLDSAIENTPPESTKGAQLLEEENRRLKEAKLCKICMDQDVNIVFLPCGHLVTCSSCAANIPDCPVCRQIIKGTVRTFLA